MVTIRQCCQVYGLKIFSQIKKKNYLWKLEKINIQNRKGKLTEWFKKLIRKDQGEQRRNVKKEDCAEYRGLKRKIFPLNNI